MMHNVSTFVSLSCYGAWFGHNWEKLFAYSESILTPRPMTSHLADTRLYGHVTNILIRASIRSKAAA